MLTVLALLVALILAACGGAPPQEDLRTYDTSSDASGRVVIADTDIEFVVQNQATEEALEGIEVRAVTADGMDEALLFVEDSTGEHAPRVLGWPSDDGALAQQAESAPVVHLARGETGWDMSSVSGRLMGWYRDRTYNCYESELDYLQRQFTPEIGWIVSAPIDHYASIGMTKATAAMFSLSSAAAVAIGFKAIAAAELTQFTVDSAVGFALASFRSAGWEGDQIFTYCVKKPAVALNPLSGPIAFFYPNEEPREPAEASSEIGGRVLDASDGQVIADATVHLAGPVTMSQRTDSSGQFLFEDLAEGEYSLTAHKAGYDTQARYFTVGEGLNAIDLTLSPAIASDDVRVVLSWGESPSDLDSHLWTPVIEGDPHHVYYAQRGSETSPPYASLDRDDRSSFGPETITLWRERPGTYTYAVHDYTSYSGSGSALFESGARVEVFDGDGLVASYDVSDVADSTGGVWWHVFTYDGDTRTITMVNELEASPPDTSLGLRDTLAASFIDSPK
jgi:uncharacterized protein YfaP (DUF2135 family)